MDEPGLQKQPYLVASSLDRASLPSLLRLHSSFVTTWSLASAQFEDLSLSVLDLECSILKLKQIECAQKHRGNQWCHVLQGGQEEWLHSIDGPG